MKITMAAASSLNDAQGRQLAGPGETIEVEDQLGQALVNGGSATRADSPSEKEGT